jgi:hypothetical protein
MLLMPLLEQAVNTLDAEARCSKFVDEPHVVVLLDGVPLDIFLAKATAFDSEGLVSTLDGCLVNSEDRQLVRSRALPPEGTTSVLPLLVCPDDLDFDCTTVVAEVTHLNGVVQWRRFGQGAPEVLDGRSADLGIWAVEWFDGVGPFSFTVENYRAFLQRCDELKVEWWREVPAG